MSLDHCFVELLGVPNDAGARNDKARNVAGFMETYVPRAKLSIVFDVFP